MQKKYISDVITTKEIKKWQPGNRILVCSQTGSGKSEVIKTGLYDYAKTMGKKILLMSNRNLLKNQNIVDIGSKKDVIKVHNYQEYESRILGGLDIDELFRPFDYVVYDESHYFFSDSQFNRNTDLLISPIKATPADKIFIFMTATPDALLDYQSDYDYVYNLPQDYSYIDNIYFYNMNEKSSVVEAIIQNAPQEDKILYFGSNAEDIWRLSTHFPNDAAFICSSSNKMADKSSAEAIADIVNHARFSPRILFSTKVLDNGVNLKDENLKHVIIDISDPISFIQTMGRKRCLSAKERITLYVRNYHKGMLFYIIKGLRTKIKMVEDYNKLLPIDFRNKYSLRDSDNLFDDNYNLNHSRYQHYLTQKRLLETMFYDDGKNGYKNYICKLLNFPVENTRDANKDFERISIKDLMEKYLGVKMFKDDQEKFKLLFFDKIFTPKKTEYIARGIKAANGILEEDGLDYKIYSRQEFKNINKNKTYWIVEKQI